MLQIEPAGGGGGRKAYGSEKNTYPEFALHVSNPFVLRYPNPAPTITEREKTHEPSNR